MPHRPRDRFFYVHSWLDEHVVAQHGKKKRDCPSTTTSRLNNPTGNKAGAGYRLIQSLDDWAIDGEARTDARVERLLLGCSQYAAIASIADCVPLLGATRTLARLGFAELSRAHHRGLNDCSRQHALILKTTPEASRPCLFSGLFSLDCDSVLCSSWRVKSAISGSQ